MRNTFDEAIGTSPVSTLDVDAVVAKGRRRASLRRFAVAGAGTAVVGVTAVVTALALTTFGPSAPGAPSPPELGVGSTADPDGSAPVREGETPEQTERRLAAALTDGLTAALPGVRISDGPTGRPEVVVHHDPDASIREYDSDNVVHDPDAGEGRYDSDIVLTTAADEGEVFFESWPGGAMPGQLTWIESCADVPAPYEDCEQSAGPDGQTIVVLSARIREGAQGEATDGGPGATPVEGAAPGEVAFHYAFVTWTNAKVGLTIASDTKRGNPDAVAGPLLLTRQKLVDIAIDPDLAVTA
jgi:hypothetical protein